MNKSRLLGAVCACAITFVSPSAALAAGPLDGIVGGGSNPWLVMNDRVIQLEGRITTIEGQVEANRNSITSLEGQSDALLVLINENLSSISDIRTKIAELENELKATDAALYAEIDALKLSIALLQSYLDEDGDGTFDLESRLLQQIQHNTTLIQALRSYVDELFEDLELAANIENQECPPNMIVIGIDDGTLTCTSNIHGGLNTWSVGKTVSIDRTENGGSIYFLSCRTHTDYVYDPDYTVVATGGGFNGLGSATDIIMSSSAFDDAWEWRFRRFALTTDSIQLFVKCVRVRN